jgi:hypothetical protein
MKVAPLPASSLDSPKWVNRVVLAAGRLLPIYPEKQTFAVSEGMSQMGH